MHTYIINHLRYQLIYLCVPEVDHDIHAWTEEAEAEEEEEERKKRRY